MKHTEHIAEERNHDSGRLLRDLFGIRQVKHTEQIGGGERANQLGDLAQERER